LEVEDLAFHLDAGENDGAAVGGDGGGEKESSLHQVQVYRDRRDVTALQRD